MTLSVTSACAERSLGLPRPGAVAAVRLRVVSSCMVSLVAAEAGVTLSWTSAPEKGTFDSQDV